jgi:hypothetical protein
MFVEVDMGDVGNSRYVISDLDSFISRLFKGLGLGC